MALDNYTNLKSAIASNLARSDLSSNIDDFIDIAEARFNRKLRVEDMVKSATLSTTSATELVSLPSDFLAFDIVEHNDAITPKSIGVVSKSQLSQSNAITTIGRPTQVARVGISGSFSARFGKKPDGVYSIDVDYYAKVPALSDSNTTNWLLDRSPDLYLYASLAAAEGFLMDDQRLILWQQGSTAIMDEMILESEGDAVSRQPTAGHSAVVV